MLSKKKKKKDSQNVDLKSHWSVTKVARKLITLRRAIIIRANVKGFEGQVRSEHRDSLRSVLS